MKVEQTISCPRIARLISSGIDSQKRFLDLMKQWEKINSSTGIRRSDLEERSRLIGMRIEPVINAFYNRTDGITDIREECAQTPRCRRCLINNSIRNS